MSPSPCSGSCTFKPRCAILQRGVRFFALSWTAPVAITVVSLGLRCWSTLLAGLFPTGLTDRLKVLRVLLEAPHVNVGCCGDPFDGGLIKGEDGAGRRADDERFVREALAFGDECAGADQAIFADTRPVEQDRAHADQAVGANGAAMQDDIVADHAIGPDRQWESGIGM